MTIGQFPPLFLQVNCGNFSLNKQTDKNKAAQQPFGFVIQMKNYIGMHAFIELEHLLVAHLFL